MCFFMLWFVYVRKRIKVHYIGKHYLIRDLYEEKVVEEKKQFYIGMLKQICSS